MSLVSKWYCQYGQIFLELGEIMLYELYRYTKIVFILYVLVHPMKLNGWQASVHSSTSNKAERVNISKVYYDCIHLLVDDRVSS